MIRAAALAVIFGVSAFAAEPKNEGHSAPAPTLEDQPRAVSADRQALLSELWQRRLLSPELDRWAAEDVALLQRVRAAENEGAVKELQRVYGGLKGWAVPYKITTAGRASEVLRLTKEGFEKWLFLRSQKAIEYFASRDIEQKWAFQLTDEAGNKLFENQRGTLTPAGDLVYTKIRLGLPVRWKTSAGVVMSNKRIRPGDSAPSPAPAAEQSLPVTIGPEHPALVDQARRAYGARYEPVMRGAQVGRLSVVVEHDPLEDQSGFIVVVARAKDKAAARAEVVKRLPHLGAPPAASIVTVEEKLAAMDANLKHVEEHTGKKGYWTIDRAAVEKQLRDLLKGRLAVVWALAGPPPAQEPPSQPAPEAAASKP